MLAPLQSKIYRRCVSYFCYTVWYTRRNQINTAKGKHYAKWLKIFYLFKIYIYANDFLYLLACRIVNMHVCTSVFMNITRFIYLLECVFFMFLILICVSFSSFYPQNHHLSPNSPRLVFLFVNCATGNKIYSYLLLSYGITLISALIGNYIHYKEWDEIIYPFRHINNATVKDREWISYFIPHFTGPMITYPCWD